MVAIRRRTRPPKATMSQKILTRFAFMADDGYP
jgi:hypothetical protein